MIRMLEWIKEDTKKLTEDTSKMQKQLNKLTESHNELRKQLELHINGSSGDDSSAPRCCLLSYTRSGNNLSLSYPPVLLHNFSIV